MKSDDLIERGRVLSQMFSRVLVPFGLLIFLIPFMGLMFFASLSVDDFAKAILATPGYICVSQPHLVSAAWSEYTTGSGRWLANLLESAAMNKVNLSWGYGWLLLLVMLSNVFGLSYLFENLSRVSRTRALLAAGVLYAVWLATFSFPGENLYWLSGAIEYQLSITTLLIVAGLLCKSRHTVFSYLALAVLAIAVPAQHEIAGVLLCVCSLGGLIAARVLKLQLRPWSLCFGLATISLAAIMLSPGMANKVAGGHQTGAYVALIRPHAKRVVKDALNWVLNPPVLLGMFCIPLLLWSDEDTESEYRPPRWLALACIVAICLVLGELSNAEMVSGLSEFPPRVVGWFQFIFCLLLVCTVCIGIPEISKIRFSTGSRIGIFTLFVASLLISGNFYQATKDLRGPARAWHRSSVARLAETGGVIQLDALPPKPTLFIETGLSKNTGCWVNQCLAVYLGANMVGLSGPSENHWGGGNPCSDPIAQ